MIAACAALPTRNAVVDDRIAPVRLAAVSTGDPSRPARPRPTTGTRFDDGPAAGQEDP